MGHSKNLTPNLTKKVFLGYNVATASPVAIKIIDWKVIMKDKQPQQLARAKKQLTNEIAIMKQVTHVNAVQLYEVAVSLITLPS